MTQNVLTNKSRDIPNDRKTLSLKNISYLGGIAALLTALTALTEILITFLPGGYTTAETVIDWFSLYQTNPFMGLRNMGLLNIIMTGLGIPMIFAIYWVHRKNNEKAASLALIIAFIGTTIFFATNRAFPMLSLSAQYAAATDGTSRAILEAAGLAILSVGQSHTPGTFLAFFLSEIGGILFALVIIRARIFNRGAAFTGLIGYGCLLVFEILATFVPSLHSAIMIVAMIGGLSNITWYILVGIGFFKLVKREQ